MEFSKKVYTVTNYTDCVMFLASFNFFAKDYQDINFNPGLESRLLSELPEHNIVRYNTDVYLSVLNLIKSVLDKKYSVLFKCCENEYVKDTFFYCTNPPHEEAPTAFLSIVYRISSKDGRRIFSLRISPYLSTETDKFELSYGLHTTYFTDSLEVLKGIETSNYVNGFTCSTVTPCFIKNYKMLNYVFPDGLDTSRKNYLKDLSNLRDWCVRYSQYKMEIDDSGILVSRNKQLRLSGITEEIPKLSSYIITH